MYHCAALKITFSIFGRILRILFSGTEVKLIYHRSGGVITACLKVAGCYFGERLTLEKMAQPPWAMSAAEFCDAQGDNQRIYVHRRTRAIVRRIEAEKKAGRLADLTLRFPPNLRPIASVGFDMALGAEMEDHVFLAYRLNFLFLNRSESPDQEFILLLPKRWWSAWLKEELVDLPIEVWICGTDTLIAAVVKGAAVTVWDTARRLSRGQWGSRLRWLLGLVRLKMKQPESSKENFSFQYRNPKHRSFLRAPNGRAAEGNLKVCTLVFDGFDPRRFSNAKWYWSEIFQKSDMIFAIWPHSLHMQEPEADLLEFFEMAGSKVCRIWGASYRPGNSVPVWKTGMPFWRHLCRAFFNCCLWAPSALLTGNSALRWQLWCYWESIVDTAWWYDFFERNRVNIFVEELWGMEAVTRSMAMRKLGGVTIYSERSLEYDHELLADERPADVHFMAGPYSLKQVLKPAIRKNIVFTGFMRDNLSVELLDTPLDKLRQEWAQGIPLVLFIDEPGTIYGEEHVLQFYRALLEDLHTRGGYRLLIKPKKDIIFKKMITRLNPLLVDLIDGGDVIVLDPTISISFASAMADVAISVPSTAMFDPMVAGKPTVVYNPCKTIKSVFYEHGLKDIIVYEDMHKLIEDLRSYLAGSNSAFGISAEFLQDINPFLDDRAADRMAFFIESLQVALEECADRDEAIERAIKSYREFTGGIYSGNFCELWEIFLPDKPVPEMGWRAP